MSYDDSPATLHDEGGIFVRTMPTKDAIVGAVDAFEEKVRWLQVDTDDATMKAVGEWRDAYWKEHGEKDPKIASREGWNWPGAHFTVRFAHNPNRVDLVEEAARTMPRGKPITLTKLITLLSPDGKEVFGYGFGIHHPSPGLTLEQILERNPDLGENEKAWMHWMWSMARNPDLNTQHPNYQGAWTRPDSMAFDPLPHVTGVRGVTGLEQAPGLGVMEGRTVDFGNFAELVGFKVKGDGKECKVKLIRCFQ